MLKIVLSKLKFINYQNQWYHTKLCFNVNLTMCGLPSVADTFGLYIKNNKNINSWETDAKNTITLILNNHLFAENQICKWTLSKELTKAKTPVYIYAKWTNVCVKYLSAESNMQSASLISRSRIRHAKQNSLVKWERKQSEWEKKLIHDATVLSFLCNAQLRLKSRGSIPLPRRPIKLRGEI